MKVNRAWFIIPLVICLLIVSACSKSSGTYDDSDHQSNILEQSGNEGQNRDDEVTYDGYADNENTQGNSLPEGYDVAVDVADPLHATVVLTDKYLKNDMPAYDPAVSDNTQQFSWNINFEGLYLSINSSIYNSSYRQTENTLITNADLNTHASLCPDGYEAEPAIFFQLSEADITSYLNGNQLIYEIAAPDGYGIDFTKTKSYSVRFENSANQVDINQYFEPEQVEKKVTIERVETLANEPEVEFDIRSSKSMIVTITDENLEKEIDFSKFQEEDSVHYSCSLIWDGFYAECGTYASVYDAKDYLSHGYTSYGQADFTSSFYLGSRYENADYIGINGWNHNETDENRVGMYCECIGNQLIITFDYPDDENSIYSNYYDEDIMAKLMEVDFTKLKDYRIEFNYCDDKKVNTEDSYYNNYEVTGEIEQATALRNVGTPIQLLSGRENLYVNNQEGDLWGIDRTVVEEYMFPIRYPNYVEFTDRQTYIVDWDTKEEDGFDRRFRVYFDENDEVALIQMKAVFRDEEQAKFCSNSYDKYSAIRFGISHPDAKDQDTTVVAYLEYSKNTIRNFISGEYHDNYYRQFILEDIKSSNQELKKTIVTDTVDASCTVMAPVYWNSQEYETQSYRPSDFYTNTFDGLLFMPSSNDFTIVSAYFKGDNEEAANDDYLLERMRSFPSDQVSEVISKRVFRAEKQAELCYTDLSSDSAYNGKVWRAGRVVYCVEPVGNETYAGTKQSIMQNAVDTGSRYFMSVLIPLNISTEEGQSEEIKVSEKLPSYAALYEASLSVNSPTSIVFAMNEPNCKSEYQVNQSKTELGWIEYSWDINFYNESGGEASYNIRTDWYKKSPYDESLEGVNTANALIPISQMRSRFAGGENYQDWIKPYQSGMEATTDNQRIIWTLDAPIESGFDINNYDHISVNFNGAYDIGYSITYKISDIIK